MDVPELYQKWPVFGKSTQRESQYQNEINILTKYVSDIILHILDIEAQLVTLVSDVTYLNSNAMVFFGAQVIYDSLSCPGLPVVNLFDAPVATPNVPHGQNVVFYSRPLVSTDNSISITYDAICKYVDIQLNPDLVTIASAGGTESLVFGTGVGPDMYLKGLSTTDANLGLTDNGVDITVANNAPDQIVTIASGSSISVTGVYPAFTITNLVPDETVSLTAGSGISISGSYPNFTISTATPLYATYTFQAGSASVPDGISTVLMSNNSATLEYTNTPDFTMPGVPRRMTYVGIATKTFLFIYSGGITVNSGGGAQGTLNVVQNGVTVLACGTRVASNGSSVISCYAGSTVVTLSTNDTVEFAVSSVTSFSGAFPYLFSIPAACSASFVELI